MPDKRRRPKFTPTGRLFGTIAKTGTFGGYRTFRPVLAVPGMERQFVENQPDANRVPGQVNDAGGSFSLRGFLRGGIAAAVQTTPAGALANAAGANAGNAAAGVAAFAFNTTPAGALVNYLSGN